MIGSNIAPIANPSPFLNLFINDTVTSTYNIRNHNIPMAEHVEMAAVFIIPKNTGAFMMTIGIKNKKKYRPCLPDIIIRE